MAAARVQGASAPTLNKCAQVYREYKRFPRYVAGLIRRQVGWAKLTIALAVAGRKEGDDLLRQATKESWGERELQREVQRLKGGTRGGGRTPK